MDKSSEEYISKKRAIDLWDSGKIDNFEVGTVKGLMDIHYALFHDLEGFDAGKIRKVNISKGNFRFANSMYLEPALDAIERMPENNFDQIIEKYVEMNVAHPFIEGNGRATRIWLDLILKKNLDKCIDWQRVDKVDYLEFMKISPVRSKYIKMLLKEALTEKISDREVFMKGLDQSYIYEGLDDFKAEEIDSKLDK
ncbi:protein adenylyltransferase Fic [Anaerococcus sp. Marseille-Q7828]|uniref:protein adenylyltransferase Fic n=1 Tax=Anaerococcus sp. Marseille-Q7828 TaxID=3036300 RepID=UPI0024ADFF69|nr:Fic family protein [Anaerococcus sp. Marseille-Q7828]